LWEFWKTESELFPKEIFYSNNQGISAVPHCIVMVFDGSTENVIEEEDEAFYRDLVDISYQKG